jgi:hypothetical protein
LPGPDQHVDRRQRLRAERHRAHRLDAAEHQDLVRAPEVHRRHDGGMRLPLHRGRRRHDARHAGDARRQHRHVRRGDHRELAPGHVAADRAHRDRLVPEHHAGQRLDLEVGHRRPLRLSEAPDLGLREADVLHVARAETRAIAASISEAVSANRARASPSNFSAISRTAASPRRRDVRQRRLDRRRAPSRRPR